MGRTSPNPPVACVITDVGGNILSKGYTLITGENHAEREAYLALTELASSKHDVAANFPSHHVFVSLEPCTHFGKTPPCRDLILNHRPKELTMGWRDPNPQVKSGDWSVYSEAGIASKLHPLLAQSSIPFLHGFFQRIQKKRPWVWVKSAVSIEGHFAPNSEEQIAISGVESEYYLQMLRAKFDAIVVGPKTVQIDSPGLDFRLDEDSFNHRGLVTKREPQSITPFFDAGSGVLDSLLNDVSVSSYEFHLNEIISYQPWRIFVLADGQNLPDGFLKKQSRLNAKFGYKKCLFYVLESNSENETFNQNDLDCLEDLSDFPVCKLHHNESGKFLESLAGHGINTVLLECGSFLWNFVKDNLEDGDCVLTIHSKKQISDGRRFEGQDILSNVAIYQVGNDIWQLDSKA